MKVGHLYSQITSIENLFQAWDEFKKGKRSKIDVQVFERSLEDNLFLLYEQLKTKTYRHCPYQAFNIYDPKFRHIHKALVRDRVVHHAVVSLIEPIFDKTFIYDSYSCRKKKGTHKAVTRLAVFIRRVCKNYAGSCFCLKLDIKKFFASVNQEILLNLIQKKIADSDILWLIKNIISYILPRTKTIKRMFKKLEEKRNLDNFNQTVDSYLGYLSHANTFRLQREILRHFVPQDGKRSSSPKFSLYLSQNSGIEKL